MSKQRKWDEDMLNVVSLAWEKKMERKASSAYW